jgi:alpha-mannosidase
MEPRIREFVKGGRLHIGPWFTQADTMMVSGEAILRNLAYGIRRAEALGGSMRLGYMPDQFGHSAQVPQLLRLLGIECAVLWLGSGSERPPHAFLWVAPDGSAVTAIWLQEGYATGRQLLSDMASFTRWFEHPRHGPRAGELSLLPTMGDQHAFRSGWFSDAEALLSRRPEILVAMGGYADHFSPASKVEQRVYGELRSPACSPALTGVASCRIREKQAAARATTLLCRYAEPLCAWAVQAGLAPPRELLERAWRQLLLNQAHDSAAGCGTDETHEDVKSRYHWAEQIADTICEQVLSAIAPEVSGAPPPTVMAFHPGPLSSSLLVEAEVPRALTGNLVAHGPDGICHPVQPLSATEEKPLFEGEFTADELKAFLYSCNPCAPLFGRYLTRISAHPDGASRIRLDVGLGEAPVPPAVLARDQARILELLPSAERFRVVVHGASTTRRVLLLAGPAVAAGLCPIWVGPGLPSAEPPRAWAIEGVIAAGPLRVTAQPDGTVRIEDESRGGAPIVANDLTDEGDRGDLYHFDGTGGPLCRAHTARASVLEAGPLRARLLIEQDLALPTGLTADRRERAATTRVTTITTEITLVAGERRVEFVTTLHNEVPDHRLRVLFHLPFQADRLDVDHGLLVTHRPLDALYLDSGSERPALTGPHHLFVDVSDGQQGAALMTRGVPEHEVLPHKGSGTVLALTLLRSVGWLACSERSSAGHAAGRILPTPGAQELGPQRFEYALLLHEGNWEAGDVLTDAQRYAAPPRPFAPGLKARIEVGRSLVEIAPSSVILLATYPSEVGVVIRLLNAAPRSSHATVRPAFPPREALEVDPLERPIPDASGLLLEDGAVHVSLRPWQIFTLLIRPFCVGSWR